MTVKEQILEAVGLFPGITDTELEHRLKKGHQHINQECRHLMWDGKLVRKHNPEKRVIGNYPAGDGDAHDVQIGRASQPSGGEKEEKPAARTQPLQTDSQDNKRNTMTVCGYPFSFVQDIVPECDEQGNVKKYYPQKDYENKSGYRLSQYGAGAFCRFSIQAECASGVYLWVVDGKVIYIGETIDLQRRFQAGYGNISPRNCYVGGQSTNCKMNKVVLNLYERGKTVKLFFYKTAEYKKVEAELLKKIRTPYNVKDNG